MINYIGFELISPYNSSVMLGGCGEEIRDNMSLHPCNSMSVISWGDFSNRDNMLERIDLYFPTRDDTLVVVHTFENSGKKAIMIRRREEIT